MNKPICWLCICICIILTGCTAPPPPGVKINYGSLVNEHFTPKNTDAEIILTTKDLDRPYKEIGIITAVGRKNITYDELNEKIKLKAREIGADAVIKLEYGTEARNIIVPSSYGSVGGTIHMPSCKGIVVVLIN
jgi:hypothetical protein